MISWQKTLCAAVPSSKAFKLEVLVTKWREATKMLGPANSFSRLGLRTNESSRSYRISWKRWRGNLDILFMTSTKRFGIWNRSLKVTRRSSGRISEGWFPEMDDASGNPSTGQRSRSSSRFRVRRQGARVVSDGKRVTSAPVGKVTRHPKLEHRVTKNCRTFESGWKFWRSRIVGNRSSWYRKHCWIYSKTWN